MKSRQKFNAAPHWEIPGRPILGQAIRRIDRKARK
jgi:hypothetical protein